MASFMPWVGRVNSTTIADGEWAELNHAFDAAGLTGALRYLNARTPHRFTGIFLFDDEVLINSCLINRESPHAMCWTPFPVAQSFCSLIRDTGKAFVVGNALQDARVADHPARERIISYCGVPLRMASGELFGSLCHFDYRPVRFSSLDLHFLERAAALVAAVVANEALHAGPA